MAQMETLGILQDLESLVSDQLQVVSYKWLSRNYLLSSNSAKSLLQEFVEKHEMGLEVVYALSGWLKSSPPSYHIRLVAGAKLDEAKQEFDGSCSVQVYSVQSCIPKDPAVLWNAEFVQAEELFKQPSTVDNCLRDNRFCGITNSFIKRTVEGSTSSASTPHIQSGLGLGPSKCSFSGQKISIPQTLPCKEEQTSSKVSVPSPNMVKDIKSESNSSGVQDEANKPLTNKEKANSLSANKKKDQNGKSTSGSEGSLASLWNRASAKSKASCPAEASAGASAEAQICAREAEEDKEGISSDDDGQDMNFKRTSTGEGTRKRRVVLDLSDDDEYEDAVSLASPERGQSGQFMEESIKSLVSNKSDSNVDKRAENKSKVKEKVTEDKRFNQPMKKDSSGVINDKNKETCPKEKVAPENGVDQKDKLTKTAPESPKRRKVMKTRIDDRGREVTEVVWEGEETEAKKPDTSAAKKADNGTTKKAESSTATKENSRPPVTKKSPAIGNTGASNPTGKTGNKKAGNKDPKQGNILSFFKKV